MTWPRLRVRLATVRTDTKARQLRGHAFARGLAAYRLARGGTQEQEATRAGVTARTWGRWELLRCRAPLAALAALAERWSVPVDALVQPPEPGPDAELRQLVVEHGQQPVVAAWSRVIGAL